jgi:hypothetical protein
MTKNGLPFAASTGQSDFPVETRAFWQTGFKSPYGLVFVNDVLYAFTFKGPTRSIATGDAGSEQFAFAAPIEDITKDWSAGYVHVVHDRQNELLLFIHSAAERNGSGYWISLVQPLYLRHGVFGPLIEISKPNRNMIVTGAATVGNKLYFLAANTASGNVDTFQFDEPEPVEGNRDPISGYLVWQLMDNSAEDRNKMIDTLRVTAKGSSVQVQIHAASPNGTIDKSVIEAGTSPRKTVTFANSTLVTRYAQVPVKIKNLSIWTARYSSTWSGAGIRDRLDELIISGGLHGIRN